MGPSFSSSAFTGSGSGSGSGATFCFFDDFSASSRLAARAFARSASSCAWRSLRS